MSDHDDYIPDPENDAYNDSVDAHYGPDGPEPERHPSAYVGPVELPHVHVEEPEPDPLADIFRRCDLFLVHPGTHTPTEVLIVTLIRDLASALSGGRRS